MQSDMATVQGVFLDNVGACEALVQLPPTHEVEPTVTWMGHPMLETRIRGPCLVGGETEECNV